MEYKYKLFSTTWGFISGFLKTMVLIIVFRFFFFNMEKKCTSDSAKLMFAMH